MAGKNEGPVARWSRRKSEAREGPHEDTPAHPDDRAAAEADATKEHAGDAPSEIDPAQLTPIEDLNADSDYTQFLTEGVPEALTRAALRKLWLSDPVFANLDGLNDYDENFNLIDKLITAADTDYKVGRGMLGDEDSGQPSQAEDQAVETVEDAEDETSSEDEVEIVADSDESSTDEEI
jgi:hypothetical protein